jgi:uncharacterized protein with GYD domain
MAKFLVHASYTHEGTKGLLKDGASGRRAAVEKLMASLGGKLEAFYFTFGEDDAVLIIDLPDAQAALAVGFAVRASGMVHSKTTVLVPIEEVDRAIQRHVQYVPPGA